MSHCLKRTVLLIASAAAAAAALCQVEDDEVCLLQSPSAHLVQTSALIQKAGDLPRRAQAALKASAKPSVEAAQARLDKVLALTGKSGPGKLENGESCTPSAMLDGASMDLSYAQHINFSLVERYREEGKFNAKGFPKLNYVHVPKTGGDAFQMAAQPLGPLAMGQKNVGMARLPQGSMSPTNCWFQQMPSMDLNQDDAEYVYGDSEIFCAMRDPHERAWSGACHMFKYGAGGPVRGEATSEAVNRLLQTSLEASLLDRHFGTCFWIPQTEYLQGPYGCKHVLDFDDIDNEYKRIVTQFGFGELSLPPADATHTCTMPCAKMNMSAKTLELVERIYAKDIAYWKEFKQNRSAGQQLQ